MSLNNFKKFLKEKTHNLYRGGRKVLDANNDNKIDARDFKILRDKMKKKKMKGKHNGKNDSKKG